jgi:hypothetical protein
MDAAAGPDRFGFRGRHVKEVRVSRALVLAWALCCAAAMPDPVPFKTIETGLQAGIERPREVVVRTPAEWKTLCGEYADGRSCPTIDFSKTTVVGVFLGTRPSTGYAVEIARVERDGDAVTVTYRERKPGPGEMSAQMITMPYQLVSIDRFAGPIRFVRAR